MIEELPLVMPLSEARQTNRSRVECILTRRDYINTVQLSYLACRTFIFHITSPYTNKSITDCTIIIYDIFSLVNTFLHIFLAIGIFYCAVVVFLLGLGLFRFDLRLTAVRRSPSSNSAMRSASALSRVLLALHVSLKLR